MQCWYGDTLYYPGETFEAVVYFEQDEGDYEFVRYDGFFLCGETNPRNYLVYAWADFGSLPPSEPNYGWVTGLGVEVPDIPDRYLPLRLDWAVLGITNRDERHFFTCGIPLAGDPPCFTIDKGE